jgi:hypothetical protein
MGSIKLYGEIPSNSISNFQSKEHCLDEAKKILLADVFEKSKINLKSQAVVKILINLHDSLQEAIASPLQVESARSSPIYLNLHLPRWSSMKTDGNRNANDIDDGTIKNLVSLEADLYRAMWLTCLILLSITDTSNRDHRSRKRSRSDMNNGTSNATKREAILQRTISQCQLLVRLLEENMVQPEACNDQSAPQNKDFYQSKNIWDDRILEWTNDDDDDDDDSLNILSLTKEQLEKEEYELLAMAATPIPKDTRNRQEKQWLTNFPAHGNAVESNKHFVGRLIPNTPETSSILPSVSVELDSRGILRATGGIEKDQCGWSLTSQSVVDCDHNKSQSRIHINNAVSFRTGDLTAITLDVGRDGMLWQEQISRIQENTDRLGMGKLVEEQEEIQKLWPADEVIAAQTTARELFVGEIRKKK